MSVQNVLTQLATLEATVAGVAGAYDYTAKSNAATYPAFFNWPPDGGEFSRVFASGTDAHRYTIRAELWFSDVSSNSTSPEVLARPFIALFRNMLNVNIKLNASCVTSGEGMTWRYGEDAPEGFFYVAFDIPVVEYNSATFTG